MTGRRGFTLIEVVVVVAIISIAVGLAGPRIGAGLGSLELRQAEQTVRSSLKLAKTQARREDRFQYVVFNKARRAVELINSDMELVRAQQLPASVSFVFEPTIENVALYVPPSGIIRGNPVRLKGRTGEVEIALR